MRSCKQIIHTAVFIFLIFNDIADFISDWIFYAEVKAIGKGIVYGESDQAARWALLFFCIIGTVTFVCEIFNLWKEHRGTQPIDSDILSAVVIWLEDVPQVIISWSFVLCREEPISVFQVVKAWVIITGIIIRIILSLVKYCNKDAIHSHHHVKYKVCIMLGMVVEFGFAVAIFVLTQTERDNSGMMSYRVPTTILENQLNDQQYFANTSIFVSYTNYFDANKLDPDKSDSVANWLRLTTINKLRASPKEEITFNIQFQQDATGVLKMAVWEKQAIATVSWTLVACYTVNSMSADVQSAINATCSRSNFFTDPSSFFIKFRYDEPSLFMKKNVLGDIYVNMKVNKNGQCRPFRDYRGTIEESLRDNVNMTLHYYRTNLDVNETYHLKYNGTERLTFFKNTESDMTDVKTAWKTGWRQCEATGHTAPVLDTGMDLDCSMAVTSSAQFLTFRFHTPISLYFLFFFGIIQ